MVPRTILILTLYLTCLGYIFAEESEDSPSIREYCQKKFPVEDDVIDRMLSHEYISRERNATCWYGCAMEKLSLVKDHKINWDLALKLMKTKWREPKYEKIIMKVAGICKNAVRGEDYDDICDLAFNFAMCKKVYGDSYGLPHVGFRDEE